MSVPLPPRPAFTRPRLNYKTTDPTRVESAPSQREEVRDETATCAGAPAAETDAETDVETVAGDVGVHVASSQHQEEDEEDYGVVMKRVAERLAAQVASLEARLLDERTFSANLVLKLHELRHTSAAGHVTWIKLPENVHHRMRELALERGEPERHEFD